MANPVAAVLYQDLILGIYREKIDPTTGETLGYVLVAGTSNAKCDIQRTPNFDTHGSPAGMSKEDNIFTANNIFCDPSIDVRSTDMAHVQDQFGFAEWQSVQGAPMREMMKVGGVDLSYQMFYGVPSDPPVITS